ncbi:MAG TPA: PGPGW domain-containing protein [Candidatus Angelobacter sp.]|nr:PGPGW domain-containing protein [Candidatus Angelobacter sp.]
MMAPRVRIWGREAGGWSLLGLAILFFPLPIVPTVLLVAGLLILSANHAWASTVLRKVQAKFPSLFPEKARAITTAKPA